MIQLSDFASAILTRQILDEIFVKRQFTLHKVRYKY